MENPTNKETAGGCGLVAPRLGEVVGSPGVSFNGLLF